MRTVDAIPPSGSPGPPATMSGVDWTRLLGLVDSGHIVALDHDEYPTTTIVGLNNTVRNFIRRRQLPWRVVQRTQTLYVYREER